jgi:carbon-monoxide dehydrogenase medium subunit
MPLLQIRLHQPHTLAEALRFLREFENVRVLAGGTDILVDIKEGLIQSERLVSLQKIEELRGIEERNGQIRIGAMATPAEIASSGLVKSRLPALAEAAASMASSQIRSMATIGGNIASAVPSADLPPSLIASRALVNLICSEDARQIHLLEFFTGPRMTVCREEEILTDILIPFPARGTGLSYQKIMLREANALAVASVATRLEMKNGRIEDAALVLGAVAPTPMLAVRASEFLKSKKPSEDVFRKASDLAQQEALPLSDIRGSVWYRKEAIAVLSIKSLREARSRAEIDGSIPNEKA